MKLQSSGQKKLSLALSGGLDSSAIAATANTLSESKNLLSTISLLFDDQEGSNRQEIDLIIQKNWPHYNISLDDNSELFKLDLHPKFSQIVYFPTLYLYRPIFHLAQKIGANYLMTGDGGDDIFSPGHLLAHHLQHGNFFQIFQELKNIEDESKLNYFWTQGIRPILSHLLPENGKKWRKPYLPLWANIKKYKELSKIHQISLPPLKKKFEFLWQKNLYIRLFHKGSYDWGRMQMSQLAQKYDLEMTYPLFNLDLIDFAFRLPLNQLSSAKLGKIILRNSFNNYLPEKIIQRESPQHYTSWNNKLVINQKDVYMLLMQKSRLKDLGLLNPNFHMNFSSFNNPWRLNSLHFLLHLEQWLDTLKMNPFLSKGRKHEQKENYQKKKIKNREVNFP